MAELAARRLVVVVFCSGWALAESDPHLETRRRNRLRGRLTFVSTTSVGWADENEGKVQVERATALRLSEAILATTAGGVLRPRISVPLACEAHRDGSTSTFVLGGSWSEGSTEPMTYPRKCLSFAVSAEL